MTLGAFDDRDLARALRAYARASGGDPDRVDVLAERELEEAINRYTDRIGGSVPTKEDSAA